MSPYKQTPEELQKHFLNQLEFLKASANSYDEGFVDEARRMASTIRILLHDTNASHSLLGQLNQKSKLFLSTVVTEPDQKIDYIRVGSYMGLIAIHVSNDGGFLPYLDEFPQDIVGYIDFDKYWNEVIFIDKYKLTHTRKEIVLSVVNQDGGAHVDPELNDKYAKLSREHSLGWVSGSSQKGWLPVTGAELAAVRQIAHEVLRSLVADYPQKKMITNNSGFVIGGMGLMLGIETKSFSGVGRNDPCPCGSEKKYKKCHGV